MQPQRRIKTKHPRRIAQNRIVDGSNQLWEIDIKYIYISGEDRFCFFMGVIDVFDREIIDYHFGLSCTSEDAKRTLLRALWRRQILGTDLILVVRTDNGPQFVSEIFEDGCNEFGVEHERIPPKTPNKNAHIESFHALLERERLKRTELSSYSEAYCIVAEYIDFYNKRRIHSSLYDLSPYEFKHALALGEVKSFQVRL